jgi:hypothetical protein
MMVELEGMDLHFAQGRGSSAQVVTCASVFVRPCASVCVCVCVCVCVHTHTHHVYARVCVVRIYRLCMSVCEYPTLP